uniref:Uncharacterized protein n=1 Tax=Arundo donax TaxID=35708 RepID=A0A0A8ZM73_ARUDO
MVEPFFTVVTMNKPDKSRSVWPLATVHLFTFSELDLGQS